MLKLASERLSVEDNASHPVTVCGKTLVADVSGALFWPAQRVLIVADLHLEKGSSAARGDRLLPPYDTRETLSRLAAVMDRYEPETVISLGDGLHDVAASERIGAEDLETLAMLQDACDWIWVTGNHDPAIADRLGGYSVPELTVEGIALRHLPTTARATHEISAHLHPAARISLHGYVLRRPCFVGNGLRLVMPAFGAFTGGLNVLDEAFSPLFGDDGMLVMMLGQEGLYPVAARLLRED